MLDGDDNEDLRSGFFGYGAAYGLYGDPFGGVSDILQTYRQLIIMPPPTCCLCRFRRWSRRRPLALAADARWMIRQYAISVLPSVSALRGLRRDLPQDRGLRGLTCLLGFGNPLIGAGSGSGAGGGAAINCGAVALAALRALPPVTRFLSDAAVSGGVVLADVGFLVDLPRLPDSACELQAIAGHFAPSNTTLHLGAEATETLVKSLNGSGALADYDVLVFATHGLTAGEAGAISPGLVLTPPPTGTARDDGLLSAAGYSGRSKPARVP